MRGRGGAGFPTGLKWSFMPKESSDGRPSYLVVNADESEPGTCKDREIMRHDPHTLVEGCLVAGFAMGAHTAFIYVRGEFIREREHLQAAVDQAYEARLIGKNNKNGWDFDIVVHHGAGAYICGEETALLESARGQEGPAADEAAVPRRCGRLRLPDHRQQRRVDRRYADDPSPRRILVRGHRPAEQFRHEAVLHLRPRQQARARSRRRWAIHVPRADRPPLRRRSRRLGQSLRRHPWRCLGAACLPARSHRRDRWISTTLRELKSGLGTAAVIVMDKSTDIVKAIARLSYFYKHESCGQCTPCREGTGWMWRVLERMVVGQRSKREIDMLLDVTKQVEGHTICALGDAAAWPIQGLIRHFRPEIERRIDEFTRNAAPAIRCSRRRNRAMNMHAEKHRLNVTKSDPPGRAMTSIFRLLVDVNPVGATTTSICQVARLTT